jgi:acyl-CoA synthetase (NDP forming)
MVGLDTCLKALNHSYKIGCAFKKNEVPEINILQTQIENKNTKQLTEYEGKQLIQDYGVSIPKGGIITNVSEALKAAEEITYPVTLKISDTDVSHKTELGAVRLNIQDSGMLEKACHDLFKMGPSLLIERMINDSVCELIIGVDYDPTFGKYVIIGGGGIFVEILKDSSVLLLPASRSDVLLALSKLKVYALLEGYRGSPKGDIESVVDAVISIIALIQKNDVLELDINPLIVLEEKKGAVAADVLIRLNSD